MIRLRNTLFNHCKETIMEQRLLVQLLAFFSLKHLATADCGLHDTVCEFHFEIEHMMTMTHEKSLVYPYKGKLYRYDVTNTSNAAPIPEDQVLIGDGWEETRLLSVVNKQFPGPDIIVYEGQRVIVYVTNYMRSITATIHWHGLHQVGTPWMDGVPWVTQCPIQPGQTFKYEFIAKPRGTFWWHSHSGAERTMGVFGAFIIKSRTETNVEEHIMQIQDYNHDWDSDTTHFKMEFNAIYDGRVPWKGVQSLDSSFFSKFRIQSGLINGRGRYYEPDTGIGNETPLTVFRVNQGQKYRFRVIGPGSLYPFRVSVDQHKLTVIASDGYDLEPIIAESFIINPGERFDFEIDADRPIGNYWVRGVTLEKEKPHIAEAILRYDGAPEEEPITTRQTCTASDPCLVINCPFKYYPENFTTCVTFDELKALATDDPAPSYQSSRFREFFLNFAFPGIRTFPSSINGRTFRQPSVNALTQPKEWYSPCEEPACGDRKHCKCTHTISIGNGDTVQMVFSNLGIGKGWSHPVHMHGHSFYVIKMGYGQYDPLTAAIGNDTADINCRGDPDFNFCNNATWADASWLNGNVPDVELDRPPRKDTIIVPTGGYVVVRIRANNPGLWNMHCHIELHNLDGMQMVINESFSEVPKPPKGFPECHSYPPHSYRMDHILSDDPAPIQTVSDLSEWTMWSECSVTCGSGINLRFRTCATGYACSDQTSESRRCQVQECVTNNEQSTVNTTLSQEDDDETIQIKVFWVVFGVLVAIIVLQLVVIVGIFCRKTNEKTGTLPSGYWNPSQQGRTNAGFEEKF